MKELASGPASTFKCSSSTLPAFMEWKTRFLLSFEHCNKIWQIALFFIVMILRAKRWTKKEKDTFPVFDKIDWGNIHKCCSAEFKRQCSAFTDNTISSSQTKSSFHPFQPFWERNRKAHQPRNKVWIISQLKKAHIVRVSSDFIEGREAHRAAGHAEN